MNKTDYAENSALQLTENYKFSDNTLKVVLLNVRSITKMIWKLDMTEDYVVTMFDRNTNSNESVSSKCYLMFDKL